MSPHKILGANISSKSIDVSFCFVLYCFGSILYCIVLSCLVLSCFVVLFYIYYGYYNMVVGGDVLH